MQTDDSFQREHGYTYELVPDGTSVTDAECEAALRSAKRARLEPRGLAWHGVSMLLHALLLAVASAFMVPSALADDGMPDPDQVAFISTMLSAQAEPEPEAVVGAMQTEAGGNPGTEHAPSASAGHGGPGTPGLARGGAGDGARVPGTRAEALNDAAGFGMIAVLAQTGAVTSSPWGDPLGSSRSGTAMWSGTDDVAGSGGLDLTGVGESGGPGGGIALGGVRTAGHDGGGGFGGRGPRMRGHDASAVPRVRPGAPAVGGRLPPDLVQRTVRQSFGRFRACYEMGLRGNPTLAGRVSVRFVIGRDGAVMSAANGGSDLPDAGTVSCVVGAFRGLSFPAPPDGIVTVTYPIVFSPQ